MSKPVFGRMVTAMVTPFGADLEVDYDRAAELARKLVSDGNDCLVVAGTTGESPTLTREEKLTLFSTVKQAVGKNVQVIAGTGSNSTKATVELSQAAERAGADGLLLVAPYYNKPPQEGLYRHFKSVAEACSLPIMLYNIPGRTGIEISPEVLARLAELPTVVAVKQSLPGLEPISDLLVRLQGRELAVYSGDDASTLPILALGGVGVVSVAGHIAARPMKEMIEHFFQGRVREAQQVHQRLYPIFTGLFRATNPILVKAALKRLGFPVGGVRLPLVDASPEQEARLTEALAESDLLAHA
ncbi:MAG: 4-hydroxy-tetrahydrodipicolinate synthase [Candidatus Eremiobacterota bacterium]